MRMLLLIAAVQRDEAGTNIPQNAAKLKPGLLICFRFAKSAPDTSPRKTLVLTSASPSWQPSAECQLDRPQMTPALASRPKRCSATARGGG